MTGVTTQTNTVLRRLATLTCALEDYQSFAEAGDFEHLELSRTHAAENIAAMRAALDRIEQGIGLAA